MLVYTKGAVPHIKIIANLIKAKSKQNDSYGLFWCFKNQQSLQYRKKILAPAKKELDLISKLSFCYETNFDTLGQQGRPKAISITIDLINKEPTLLNQNFAKGKR